MRVKFLVLMASLFLFSGPAVYAANRTSHCPATLAAAIANGKRVSASCPVAAHQMCRVIMYYYVRAHRINLDHNQFVGAVGGCTYSTLRDPKSKHLMIHMDVLTWHEPKVAARK